MYEYAAAIGLTSWQNCYQYYNVHLAAISGAHLAILLGLIWFAARLLFGRPTWGAAAVLVALGLFLLTVPSRVPIIRSGIMAGLFAIGFGCGRVVTAVNLLSLSAVIVLIWRPGDLFDAGFQLSFGAVAALILFTRRVSHWFWPEPLMGPPRPTWSRYAADYVAASTVASVTVLPIVAYHYELITPLAVLLSVLVLPVVTILLGLGYAKILIGVVSPTLGRLLAGPLAWFADTMIGLVDHATTWPGATLELQRPPSVAWALATIGVVAAVLAGRFAHRRAALCAAVLICVIWLLLTAAPPTSASRWAIDLVQPQRARDRRVPLRVSMLAVGDGACYLVRLNGANEAGRDERAQISTSGDQTSGSHVIMFDCGSQRHLNMGRQTVLPVLRRLGVGRIDTLVISHADLDHLGGTLDVLERVPIGRVLVSPYLLATARQQPTSPTGYLIEQLEQRQVPVYSVGRGWSEKRGGARLDMLWPPPDLAKAPPNDTSIVLRISAGGRRLLLAGDIQQRAISGLLQSGDDLRADICDLPHHGSFVDVSPKWLQAVEPSIVLQSSGYWRLEFDKWQPVLQSSKVKRFVTARDGFVQVAVDPEGNVSSRSFLGDE